MRKISCCLGRVRWSPRSLTKSGIPGAIEATFWHVTVALRCGCIFGGMTHHSQYVGVRLTQAIGLLSATGNQWISLPGVVYPRCSGKAVTPYNPGVALINADMCQERTQLTA